MKCRLKAAMHHRIYENRKINVANMAGEKYMPAAQAVRGKIDETLSKSIFFR